MKIVSNRRVGILVVALLFQTIVFAAPSLPPPKDPPPPPPLPLDGWLSVFLLFSIGYGIYKINSIRHTKKASN